MLWKPNSLSTSLEIKSASDKFMTTVLSCDTFFHGNGQEFIGRIYN